MIAVSSTKPKVRDTEKLSEILNGHNCLRVKFVLDEAGNLEVVLANNPDLEDEWPQAIKPSQLPSREAYAEEYEWEDAVDFAFGEKGDEGFLELLLEMAPYLESPLIILAIQHPDADSDAKVWLVQPAATEVQTLEVTTG